MGHDAGVTAIALPVLSYRRAKKLFKNLMTSCIGCGTLYIKAPGLMVSEKIFVCFSHCKYMGVNVP